MSFCWHALCSSACNGAQGCTPRVETLQQPKRPMGRGKPFGRMGAGGAGNYPPKRKTRRGEDPDYIGEWSGLCFWGVCRATHIAFVPFSRRDRSLSLGRAW